jgi:two-component system, cell cycle sensor histidine kinase and response regulator CckA
MNLAVNARDAMPQGGQLAITTENRTVAGGNGAAPSHFLVISVTDTGVGMDADLQARIFDPYFTTKGDSGGTGIGLSTVRAIALLSGGHIEVSSAPGEGTTMRIVLPRAMMPADVPRPVVTVLEAEEAAAKQFGGAKVAAKGKRILLIEDESGIRDLLQRWLTFQGYDLTVARNGREAIELCTTGADPVDAVLTDLHLPDMAGVTIARQLHEECPDLPVIYMSGEAETLQSMRRADRATVLTKPFTMGELTTALQTVFKTRQVA